MKTEFVGRSGADDAADRMQRREDARAAEEDRKQAARSATRIHTRDVKVDSPYGRSTNGTDDVRMVIDTIDFLLRRGDIDAAQGAAAQKVRDAWAAAPGAIRCALADGEGGGGPGSRSLTASQEWAGGILNDVRRELGRLDGLIVIRICGIGFSIEETARIVFGVAEGVALPRDRAKHIGMRLRMGLAVLARHWGLLPNVRTRGVRGAAAGRENGANFGALSESERERLEPLRHAARQRDQRMRRKGARKAKGKAKSTGA